MARGIRPAGPRRDPKGGEMKRVSCLICCALAAFTAGVTLRAPVTTWAQADPVDEHILTQAPRADATVQKRMAQERLPGLSLAVLHNGRLLLARAYGWANLEVSAPALPASVYQIASLTKPFTATGVMLLVEDGKVALDESAARYLPG